MNNDRLSLHAGPGASVAAKSAAETSTEQATPKAVVATITDSLELKTFLAIQLPLLTRQCMPLL